MQAKHADLPWDIVFSGELLGSYKPSVVISCLDYTPATDGAHRNPKVYLGAIHHLSLPPEKCAMVAAHLWDLKAAAAHGMRTVYVPRPTDDAEDRDGVKNKAEGGEVDVVVSSLEELAAIV